MIWPITGKEIIETSSCKCSDGLNKALKKIGFDEEVVWSKETEDWVMENIAGGIEWLFVNGFIKEDNGFVKEDNGFVFNQHKVYILDVEGCIYKLHKHKMDGSHTWNFDTMNSSYGGSHGPSDTPEESIRKAKAYEKVYVCDSHERLFQWKI